MSRRPLVNIALVLGLGLFAWMPVNRYLGEQEKLSAILAEETRLTEELADAQQRYIDVTGPALTERMARGRLGMVRGGERAYIVPTEEAPIERPDVIEPKVAEDDESLWGRALGAVFKSFVGRI